MPRVAPFVYFRKYRDQVRVAQHVDGTALLHLVAAFGAHGYAFGPPQLNHPKPDFNGLVREHAARPLASDDVIVSATRVELGEDNGCRKRVLRGNTTLESHIERAWSRVLLVSDRRQIATRPSVERYFEAGRASRRNVEFFVADHARYKAFPSDGRARVPSPAPTAGYLLRVRELFPGGPGYCGAFGMNSSTGLVWSALLLTRFPELVEKEGFFMAEMRGTIPDRPFDLSFVEDWDCEIVLKAPAEPPLEAHAG